MFGRVWMVCAVVVLAVWSGPVQADTRLAESFVKPPDSARPWVYWFWNNANVTPEGITADLEAMQRVGVGGVLIMDVFERFAPPRGEAMFMGPRWQELFQFALKEANRLGLEVNMTSGPGWCGSSGPWITPEMSMQMLVLTKLQVEGAGELDTVLARPANPGPKKDRLDSQVDYRDFYRDVAVLAFPDLGDQGQPQPSDVIDLTDKMDASGRLKWTMPAGKWIVQRIGTVSTGASTRPPVAGGNGLECDKLSREAVETHFAAMMGTLIRQAGPLAGKTLVATHVDSWEVGSQTWTPALRQEFIKRRGYDPMTWLPCAIDTEVITEGKKKSTRYLRHFGGQAMADRFRWDFHQTISELVADNYIGRLASLAHEHGMRFTLEGYELPIGDEFLYTSRADEPMCEFWDSSARSNTDHAGITHMTRYTPPLMTSVAHVYGRTVVGAEAFTARESEQWKVHPAMLKSQGDEMFSAGVNRFVFHRYAHQPYLDRVPGVTMGPWGQHYERTQTWWEMSGPWHEYLTRCQHMLRQGLFVADVAYLRPEYPKQGAYSSPSPPGPFRFDQCNAEAVIQRFSVKDGRLVLPDGMSYRVLVVPNVKAMTPALLAKLKELAEGGATLVVTGPRPVNSPSLTNYPQCDALVAELGSALWGKLDGKTVTQHAVGKGRVFWGEPLEKIFAGMGVPADFESTQPLNWIHRRVDSGNIDIYFVANPSRESVGAVCKFRVASGKPSVWDPLTGEMRDLPEVFHDETGQTVVPLFFEGDQSYFIVFNAPRLPLAKPQHASLVNFTSPSPIEEVLSPWQVTFQAHRGAPAQGITMEKLAPLHHSSDPRVKHFSGVATYRTTVEIAADSPLLNPDLGAMLDLGDVQVMAQVKVNGKPAGTTWRQPHRLNVKGLLKPGPNTLEISVANLWPNRMIADAALPEDQRVTWSTWQPFKPDMPVEPSGLIGPVQWMIP
jgi:hypothetical protein